MQYFMWVFEQMYLVTFHPQSKILMIVIMQHYIVTVYII